MKQNMFFLIKHKILGVVKKYERLGDYTKRLLKFESFDTNNKIFVPFYQYGHIANELKKHGYSTINSDLVYMGYSKNDIFLKNFFDIHKNNYDILTRPPFKNTGNIIEHAINISSENVKLAMLLRFNVANNLSLNSYQDILANFKNISTDLKLEYLLRNYRPIRIYFIKNKIKGLSKNSHFQYAWFIWDNKKINENKNNAKVIWI